MANTLALSAPGWLFWQPSNELEREQFIAAHDQRHRTYRLAASRAGRSIQICPLTGDMDEDWFARHMRCHMTLSQIFPVQQTQSAVALEKPPSGDDNALYGWMRRHALLHAQLDAAFGVVK